MFERMFMSKEENVKGLVERKMVRGRNVFDVVNQIVEKYNSSNGWALTKVVPNLLNLDVHLERSTKQALETVEQDASESLETVTEKALAKPEDKTVLVSKAADKKTETVKKPTSTSSKKLTEAKKV